MMLLDLCFGCLMVGVWAIKTYASRGPGVVDVGTQHIPTLAQVQHPVVPLPCPTLGCDPDSFFLGHDPHSLPKSLTGSQATEKSTVLTGHR